MKLQVNVEKFSPVEQENLTLLINWLHKNIDGDLDNINPRDETAIEEFFEGAYYALDSPSYFNLTRVQNPDLKVLWK